MAASSDAAPATGPKAELPPASQTAAAAAASGDSSVNPLDFAGAVHTDNALPSADTLCAIADLPVLDRTGAARSFSSLCTDGGPGRVLVVFVRHFFCGNCQEYLRALSQALPPAALPAGTRIVVVGCGEPPLIDMYVEASACAFPVFADPTRRLYDALGMVRTLALGSQKPAYMQGTSMWASIVRSIGQGLWQVPKGLATKGGNQRQVGGEFLFETEAAAAAAAGGSFSSRVTWCHRMTTTRDHAEVDELKTVLGVK